MSRKVNPVSFRLGLNQTWNTLFQIYGRNFYFYRFVYHKIKLESFLRTFFSIKKLILGKIIWVISPNNLILLLNFSIFNKKSKEITILPFELDYFLLNWFKRNHKIYLIKQPTWFNQSDFVIAYINHQLNNGVNSKKAIQNVLKLLNNKFFSKKSIFTSSGFSFLKLKGIKIQLQGRFETSRNQMSQKVKYTSGQLSLSTLNNYVDYSHKNVYSKSGVKNLRVWLFYSK